jgi:hypothetical protein
VRGSLAGLAYSLSDNYRNSQSNPVEHIPKTQTKRGVSLTRLTHCQIIEIPKLNSMDRIPKTQTIGGGGGSVASLTHCQIIENTQSSLECIPHMQTKRGEGGDHLQGSLTVR